MTFEFSVISTTGQRIAISVLGPNNTVGDIKAKLEELEGIPQKMIMLVHSGRKLDDNSTLEECKISGGITINMVLALRAGK